MDENILVTGRQEQMRESELTDRMQYCLERLCQLNTEQQNNLADFLWMVMDAEEVFYNYFKNSFFEITARDLYA